MKDKSLNHDKCCSVSSEKPTNKIRSLESKLFSIKISQLNYTLLVTRLSNLTEKELKIDPSPGGFLFNYMGSQFQYGFRAEGLVPELHAYIEKNFDDINSGDVIDATGAQFIVY